MAPKQIGDTSSPAGLSAQYFIVFLIRPLPLLDDAEIAKLYAAAKKEGEVVLYSDQSVELIQKLGDAFKKKFPGIDFDFFRGDTTQIMQRYESEAAAGRHKMDAQTATANQSRKLAAKGWLLKWESAVAKTYPAGMQPTTGLSYNYGINTVSFAFNSDQVKPADAPKTWNDLLDPKWKGKIGMQDPKSGGGGGAHTTLMKLHQELGEDAWHKYMDKLGAQIGKYGRYFTIREAVASGEVQIQFAAYPDFTEPLKQKGAPIDWGVPEFMYFIGLTLQVNKEAPHPNFVADFVGWTNFLPITVADRRNVHLNSSKISCVVPEEFASGFQAEIAIRPVDVRVADNGAPDDNILDGEIRTTMYMGKYLICDVAVGDKVLQAYADLGADLPPGKKIQIRFSPDSSRVLSV